MRYYLYPISFFFFSSPSLSCFLSLSLSFSDVYSSITILYSFFDFLFYRIIGEDREKSWISHVWVRYPVPEGRGSHHFSMISTTQLTTSLAVHSILLLCFHLSLLCSIWIGNTVSILFSCSFFTFIFAFSFHSFLRFVFFY